MGPQRSPSLQTGVVRGILAVTPLTTGDIYMAQADDAAADGYYGDDDMGSDELDLSFLDEDESQNDAKK
jgi:hypothetical protein